MASFHVSADAPLAGMFKVVSKINVFRCRYGSLIALALCTCIGIVVASPAWAQASTPWGVYLCQGWNLEVFDNPPISISGAYPLPPPLGCPGQFMQTSGGAQNSYDTTFKQGTGAGGEVKVAGNATLGSLSANLLANATGDLNQASAEGTESLKWIDTFTITSPTLPNGTLTPLKITATYFGQIVPPLSGQSFIYMQFIPGDGASTVPIDLSAGISVNSLNPSAPVTATATLQVHVGHTFQLGAYMTAQVVSSEGNAVSITTIGGVPNSTNQDFLFTVNIDSQDGCATYQTASGISYISGPPPSCPSSPHILFNGLDITGTTQTVVVGQPIQLTTSPAPQSGQTQSWSGIPLGAAIKAFAVTTAYGQCPSTLTFVTDLPTCTGKVAKLAASDFTSPVIPSTNVFYWITPGVYPITYQYTLPSGASLSASTTLNVEGPTSPTVTAGVGKGAITTKGGDPYLSLTGLNYTSPLQSYSYGISFTPQAIMPSSYMNCVDTTTCEFQWIQLVDGFQAVASHSQESIPDICDYTPGLDGTYPYDNVLPDKRETLFDGPRVELASNDFKVDWTFKADTYLTWIANDIKPLATGGKVFPAIAVPLGHIPWCFNATFTRQELASPVITLQPPANLSLHSSGYPEWDSLSSLSIKNSCKEITRELLKCK